MYFNISEENGKRVFSVVTWLADASQNYFASLNSDSANPTSSGKRSLMLFY